MPAVPVSSELECNRCIQQVDHQPHICSPLSVVDNGRGKLRLVINLRYLNQYLWQDKFKYEDLRIAMLMFQKGGFMFSFDLKSGYHHVDVYQPHRDFLGFQKGNSRLMYLMSSHLACLLHAMLSPSFCDH